MACRFRACRGEGTVTLAATHHDEPSAAIVQLERVEMGFASNEAFSTVGVDDRISDNGRPVGRLGCCEVTTGESLKLDPSVCCANRLGVLQVPLEGGDDLNESQAVRGGLPAACLEHRGRPPMTSFGR